MFLFLFSLSNVNKVYADLTNEFFATSNIICNNWVNIESSLGPPDLIYATISNKIPVCRWNFNTPFNIPLESEINEIKVKVYYSSSGNNGNSSMSPFYNGIQSCVPPPFWPARIFNDAHEYVVTPLNCPTTFPTLAQLNSSGMSWRFFNSGNINAAIDAVSMRVSYTPFSTPAPLPLFDLPWDYEGKGISFNEAALAINSYFDHDYPLLSSGLSEPADSLGTIINYLGFPRVNKFYSSHDGYDYGIPANVHLGDPVLAAGDGIATYINSCSDCGNMIIIDHGNGYQTRYLHLQKDGLISSTPGEEINVNAGQQIGLVGATGKTTGAHIHFGVFQDKNNDGNFSDNIPDGVTDPFGWQSKDPDPWETYSFFYNGEDRSGNKSYYLWKKNLDKLDAILTSNGGVFNTERFELDFPQDSVVNETHLSIKSAPIIKDLNNLSSIGSTLDIHAFDSQGNEVLNFEKEFTLTVGFNDFDLIPYNTDSFSIYSSADGVVWNKEPTLVDFVNKSAIARFNHLTHFALMAERFDTDPPVTTAVLDGQNGQSNWFRSDAYVSLNSDDGRGLGTDYTLYRKEDEDWETYEGPLLFTDEGHHKIEFYSVDKDENIEDVKSVKFDIDKTAPEAEIDINPKTIWPANGKMINISVTGDVSDLHLFSKQILVIDEYDQIQPAISDFGQTIQLEAKRRGNDLDGRIYVLGILAEDLAGNVKEDQVKVVVPHDQGKDK